MILLIDNYDSFVFNLARYFEQLGQTTHVVRNDAIDVAGVRAARPDLLVLSPGPCTPAEAGCGIDVVRSCQGEFPILGVCLGHQTIGAALGGDVIRAQEPMHGRSSEIEHDGHAAFEGIENPFSACRYHSLVLDEATLPGEFEVTARTTDRVIMAVRHHTLPIEGWQFHPESVLTRNGYRLIANLLDHFKIANTAADLGELPSPCAAARVEHPEATPKTPLTF